MLPITVSPIQSRVMKQYPYLLRLLSFFLLVGLIPLTHAQDPSVGATKHGNARFFELHASFLKRAASGPAGVVFLGDSITEGWTKVPEIWESAWGKYQPANFGIGGDRTQHVIWRIEQGEFDKISPKVVVLMIGTNNTGNDSAKEIAAANRKIVGMLQEALPETKILLLAVFPRGPRNARGVEDPWEMKMKKIRAINNDLAKLDNGRDIRFLDLGPKFMSADGTIAKAIMPDQLHLALPATKSGSKAWLPSWMR